MREKGPRSSVLERPRQRFAAELKRSMMVLSWELGKSINFNNARLENFVSGKQGPVLFDEPLGDGLFESYEYSGDFRPREGIELIDALSLKRQDCSLFLQYARQKGKRKSASTAELIIGDKTYRGKEALAHIHEAFPRFYPANALGVKVA